MRRKRLRLALRVLAARHPRVTRLAGGGVQLACAVEPTDALVVAPAPGSPAGEGVVVIVADTRKGTMESVVLLPREARRVAATLLDLADAADGLDPLVIPEAPPSG